MFARFKFVFFVLMALGSKSSFSAVDYLQGNIVDMTSTKSGLMLKIDSGFPGNCAGTPFGWMLIRSENKPMIALVLSMYAYGKRAAVVYTSPAVGGGFCEINQFDPIE